MNREFSAGGVVFNQNNQVLLTKNNGGYWQFPKGHLDDGETVEQAALREVKEEGGVEAKIINKLGVEKYVYTTASGEKIFKIVSYFLMEYLSGDPKDHDFEVADSAWTNPDEALKKLSFSSAKTFLKKALDFRVKVISPKIEAVLG